MSAPAKARAVLDTVLAEHADQALSPAERQGIAAAAAAVSGGQLDPGAPPPALAALAEKIARHAYKVTEDELAALKAAGHTEEQLFEAVIAAAVGAAWARLTSGLRALERGAIVRLECARHGNGLLQKLGFAVIRQLVGQVPGPILTFSHRPHFLGRSITAAFQEALRGPSEWSIGERELFAAFVSKVNQCPY